MFDDLNRDTVDVFGSEQIRSTIEGMQQQHYGRHNIHKTLGEDLRIDQSAKSSIKTE
jgi:hypothetical protein